MSADKAQTNCKREVRVRATICHVIHIDLQAQIFKAKVRLEVSWVDPALKDVCLEANRNQQELEVDEDSSNQASGFLKVKSVDRKFFAPRLAILNCIDKHDEEQWFRIFQTGSQDPPVVCFFWSLTGEFQEAMELDMFPLDSQKMALRLQAFWERTRTDGNQVMLVRNHNISYRSFCNTGNFCQASEYQLFDRLQFCPGWSSPADSSTGCIYPTLDIMFRVQRKAGYWILNVVLPLFFLTTCLFFGYAVPPDDVADRLSVTLTVLLAQVAFKYAVSDKLPKISYATLIDWYVLACFILSFLVGFDQTLTKSGFYSVKGFDISHLSHADRDPEEEPPECSAVLVVGLLSWLGLHILSNFVLQIIMRQRDRLDSYWNSPNNAVWIGPLATDQDVSGDVRTEAELAIFKSMSDYGKVCNVIIWSAEVARNHLDNEGSEDYLGQRTFAVVRFQTHQDAMAAIHKFGSSQALPSWAHTCTKAEPLNPSWYALTSRQKKMSRQTRVSPLEPIDDHNLTCVSPLEPIDDHNSEQ